MAANPVTTAYRQAVTAQTQLLLAQAAQEQAITQFEDLYLTPQGDADNRVGSVINTNQQTVDAVAFPPFQHIQVGPDPTLGTALRAGGFTQLNKQINAIQKTLLFLTGQIRTKLTEWDISIYLQQGLIDKDVAAVEANLRKQFQLQKQQDLALGIPAPNTDNGYYLTGHFYSLLYNLVKDNPSGYGTNRQAAVHGMLNAALTSWRYETWDPRFDPDLQYWSSPTLVTSLLSFAEALAKTSSAVQGIFGSSSSLVRTSLPASAQQAELASILKEPKNNAYWLKQIIQYWGGQTNPPYWELFYTSPNYLPTTTDQQNYESKYDSYRNNNQAAPASGNSIGLNVLSSYLPTTSVSVVDASPIFSGGPYGTQPDPRSLGSFFLTGYDFPKLPPSEGSVISQSYIASDPFTEYQQLNQDWYSQTPILNAASYAVPAVNIVVTTKNNYGQIISSGTTIEKLLSPVLRSVWNTLNPVSQSRGYGYGTPETVTIPTFQSTGTFSRRTGYWPNAILVSQNAISDVVDGVLVGSKSKITFTPYGDATSLFSQLAVGESAPITMVSQDGRYVVEAIIKHDIKTTYVPGTTYRFLFWTYTTSVAVHQDILTVDAYTGLDLYPVDLSDGTQENVTTPRISSITEFFNHPGVTFQGLYFSIPKRSLTAGQSIIRDGWTSLSTPIPQSQGIALARSRLTFLWRNGSLVSFPSEVAPFRGMLKGFYNAIGPMAQAVTQNLLPVLENLSLSALQLSFTPGQVLDGPTLAGMTDIQNYFLNANMTQLSNEFVAAKAAFQAFIKIFTDTTPGSMDPTQLGLVSLVQYLAGIGSHYAVPAGSNVTQTLDQRFTLAAYSRFQDLYFNQLATYSTATSSMLQLYKMLDRYLRLMYERRFTILKKRLNISDGTLLQVARMESAIMLVQENAQPDTTPGLGQAPLEDLPVVFQVTSQTQAMKALAFANNIALPPEKLLIVYTPVKYDSSNNIIRPLTGVYHLVSMEYTLDTTGTIPAVSFPLSFQEGNAPPIVHGIPTGIDPALFAQAQTQNSLTLQEKICFAIQTNDLWEIVIPLPTPLRADYLTALHLMTMPPDQAVADVTAILGGGDPSPIHEQPTQRPQPLSTWASAPNSVQTAAGITSKA